nr:MAG TPA: hypothetical protein [Caudoviricetes sp.]
MMFSNNIKRIIIVRYSQQKTMNSLYLDKH